VVGSTNCSMRNGNLQTAKVNVTQAKKVGYNFHKQKDKCLDVRRTLAQGIKLWPKNYGDGSLKASSVNMVSKRWPRSGKRGMA
jgi:hypothetical protein